MEPFVLISDVTSLLDANTRLVEVPTELADKHALLTWYAEALQLPVHFGFNWDALDECLSDLSWIRERRVVLYHRTVPLEASPEDQKIYIDVVAAAARGWKPGEFPELVVAFDAACEPRLQAVTRTR
jgi:hypothetical protein